MTDIDLASGEAANFIFRMPHNIKGADGNEVYMSMLAVPELESVEMESSPVYAYGWFGTQPLCAFNTHPELTMNLNLRAVQRTDSRELCQVIVT